MKNSEFQTYLTEKINIDAEILDELFKKDGDNLFNIALALIEVYKIDKAELGKIWGSSLGFAYVDPNSSIVNPEFTKKIGVDFITANNVLPLYKFGKAVTVSTSNPTNPYIQDKVEKKLDELVSFVFCFPFDIQKYIKDNNLK